jgi:PEGA domain-containing protein
MTRASWIMVVAALGGVWLAGCGPSHRTMTMAYTIQTKPSGARVYVDGEPRGDSPQKISLEFKYNPENLFDGVARHFIHVEKAGHEPAEREVRLSDPSTVFFILAPR